MFTTRLRCTSPWQAESTENTEEYLTTKDTKFHETKLKKLSL